MEEKAGSVDKKTSLINNVIERFNNELNEMEKMSTAILNKVSLIKNAYEPRPKEDVEETPEDGIIHALNKQLNRMNDLNYVLHQAMVGLTESVG